jgi:hypothetical protein
MSSGSYQEDWIMFTQWKELILMLRMFNETIYFTTAASSWSDTGNSTQVWTRKWRLAIAWIIPSRTAIAASNMIPEAFLGSSWFAWCYPRRPRCWTQQALGNNAWYSAMGNRDILIYIIHHWLRYVQWHHVLTLVNDQVNQHSCFNNTRAPMD